MTLPKAPFPINYGSILEGEKTYLDELVIFEGCGRNLLVLFDESLVVLDDFLSLLHYLLIQVHLPLSKLLGGTGAS